MNASSQTTALPLHQSPQASVYTQFQASLDAVQVLIDWAGLPAQKLLPGLSPDSVTVLLADIEDMKAWLAGPGGRLRIGPSAAGLVEWTLAAEVEATRRHPVVRVEVHAMTVVGQFVCPSIREQVAV